MQDLEEPMMIELEFSGIFWNVLEQILSLTSPLQLRRKLLTYLYSLEFDIQKQCILYLSSHLINRPNLRWPDLYFWIDFLSVTVAIHSQCPRTDLNKRLLPRPKTTTAWKLIPHRSKISKNWNPPRVHRFLKNWFLIIQKQLYSNYVQTHFT